jgi:hypothetical protein
MDRVEPGQEFDVERVDRGDYRLVRRAAPPNEGAIRWLLACPQRDFFIPIDPESADALRCVASHNRESYANQSYANQG